MNSVINRILERINEGKKWFFCDYYDTLVERDCHPEDIKGFWASEMAYELNYNISEACIRSARFSSEKALSEKYNGLMSVSYNYNQLCREIYNRLVCINREGMLKIFSDYDSFYEKSLKIETQVEKKHQFLIKTRIESLKRIKQTGAKIAVVSDFYIGKEGFDIYAPKELMAYVDKVFISCDYGFRKDTGELYDYALKTLKVEPRHVVMVGDNKKSDKYIPEAKGITAFLVKKRVLKQKTVSMQEKALWNLMKRNKGNTYVNYAFSLYYFIDGLYRYLRKSDIESVLFCSREGEFLRELFNLYVEQKKCTSIENKYFYVSRLASFVPSLKNLESEKFENLFRQWKDLSPKSFMKSIGFSESDITEICKKNNIIPEKIIVDFQNSEEFKTIKNSSIFIRYYKEKINIQKTNFISYLNSLCTSKSDICIVDVGWKGTIQDNIYNIYDGKRRITGIYLGITENLQFSSRNTKIGINFTTYPCISENFDIWSYDKSFYEKLLYASHASTSGYGDDSKPVLENYANEKATYEYIRPMQLDIIEVFKSIITIMNDSYYTTTDLKSIYTKIHLYMICHIGNKHLKMQNILIKGHSANFGEFSWSQKKIAEQVKTIFMSNPKEIIKRLLKDGLDIKFMYPGIKVLEKYNCKCLILVYTRLVYLKMARRL